MDGGVRGIFAGCEFPAKSDFSRALQALKSVPGRSPVSTNLQVKCIIDHLRTPAFGECRANVAPTQALAIGNDRDRFPLDAAEPSSQRRDSPSFRTDRPPPPPSGRHRR